jgi:hypothetical protein
MAFEKSQLGLRGLASCDGRGTHCDTEGGTDSDTESCAEGGTTSGAASSTARDEPLKRLGRGRVADGKRQPSANSERMINVHRC